MSGKIQFLGDSLTDRWLLDESSREGLILAGGCLGDCFSDVRSDGLGSTSRSSFIVGFELAGIQALILACPFSS